MIRKSLLPDEYQQVEYVESTGDSMGLQYINTGYIPNTNGFKVNVVFNQSSTNNNTGCFIYGAYDSTDGYKPSLYLYHVTRKIGVYYNSSLNKNTEIIANLDKDYDVTVTTSGSNVIYDINGATGSITTEYSPVNNNTPIVLFTSYVNNTYILRIKIKKFLIYDENNVLIRDMIPCYRKSDNAIGMYDVVHNVFYPSQGTGTMNKGYDSTNEVSYVFNSLLPDEYQQVEYVESNGTQYIDTGIYATSNTGIKVKYRYTNEGSAAIAGIYQGNNPRTDTLFISSVTGQTDGNLFCGHCGYITTSVKINLYLNTDYICSANYLNSGEIYFNNTLYNIVGTNGVYNATIPIFARYNHNNDNISISNSRIYYVEFTEGNTVSHKLIPCYRKSDNVIGFYDIINSVFYTNSGTGTFIKGNDVIPDFYNIDEIYLGTDLVFEQGFTREDSGIPPIITSHKTTGKKLKDYKIYGNSIQKNIPEEYQEVEYLESTGTQYIDTGLIGTNETKLEIDFSANSVETDYDGICGSRTSASANDIALVYSGNAGIVLDFNSSTYDTYRYVSNTASLNVKYKAIIDKNSRKLFINGESVGSNTTICNDAITTPTNIMLFAVGGTKPASSSNFNGKIYIFKVYENNELIRNMIPCYRKSDNVIGMYDTINNVFYTNTGTGTFTVGRNVPLQESPIEIKSVGDLVTDTGDVNYGKYKIPIIASDGTNSITTNIYLNEPLREADNRADYVDFANQKVIRNIASFTFTSSDGWALYKTNATNRVYNLDNVLTPLMGSDVLAPLCSHFKQVSTDATASFNDGEMRFQKSVSVIAGNRIYVCASQMSLSEYNNWLDINKPELIYPLSIPIEESIQLPKIPSFEGITTYSINTKVQPSNMYIKYKGR